MRLLARQEVKRRHPVGVNSLYLYEQLLHFSILSFKRRNISLNSLIFYICIIFILVPDTNKSIDETVFFCWPIHSLPHRRVDFIFRAHMEESETQHETVYNKVH